MKVKAGWHMHLFTLKAENSDSLLSCLALVLWAFVYTNITEQPHDYWADFTEQTDWQCDNTC